MNAQHHPSTILIGEGSAICARALGLWNSV